MKSDFHFVYIPINACVCVLHDYQNKSFFFFFPPPFSFCIDSPMAFLMTILKTNVFGFDVIACFPCIHFQYDCFRIRNISHLSLTGSKTVISKRRWQLLYTVIIMYMDIFDIRVHFLFLLTSCWWLFVRLLALTGFTKYDTVQRKPYIWRPLQATNNQQLRFHWP